MVIPIRVGDPEMIEFKRVLLLSGNHRANYANDFFFFSRCEEYSYFVFSRGRREFQSAISFFLSFFLFFMIIRKRSSRKIKFQ